jgi:hypothetical protein
VHLIELDGDGLLPLFGSTRSSCRQHVLTLFEFLETVTPVYAGETLVVQPCG